MKRLREWVAGLEWVTGVTVDALPWKNGCVGLFPAGERLLRRDEDVLGNVWERRQVTVTVAVCLEKPPGMDASENRELLEALAMDLSRLCPELGQEQRVFCAMPRLKTADQQGLARYETELVMEFTRPMENGQ